MTNFNPTYHIEHYQMCGWSSVKFVYKLKKTKEIINRFLPFISQRPTTNFSSMILFIYFDHQLIYHQLFSFIIYSCFCWCSFFYINFNFDFFNVFMLQIIIIADVQVSFFPLNFFKLIDHSLTFFFIFTFQYRWMAMMVASLFVVMSMFAMALLMTDFKFYKLDIFWYATESKIRILGVSGTIYNHQSKHR